MRHCKRLKKLGLKKSHRTSLLRNLVGSLVLEERIKTTESRAKALAARFGRMMNGVLTKDPREAIRLLPGFCTPQTACIKVMTDIKKKYEKRSSGFTRITRLGTRKGDNASLVSIELV